MKTKSSEKKEAAATVAAENEKNYPDFLNRLRYWKNKRYVGSAAKFFKFSIRTSEATRRIAEALRKYIDKRTNFLVFPLFSYDDNHLVENVVIVRIDFSLFSVAATADADSSPTRLWLARIGIAYGIVFVRAFRSFRFDRIWFHQETLTRTLRIIIKCAHILHECWCVGENPYVPIAHQPTEPNQAKPNH